MDNDLGPTVNEPDNIGDEQHAYTYRPLDSQTLEIRLINLAPAVNTNDPIVAAFLYASLISSHTARYETVSYTWGDASQRSTITISGQLFDICKSAEHALRRLRNPDVNRVLRIDGVCINQNDLDERSEQVAMMADIYRKAGQNLIWLGEEDESTTEALAAINKVYMQAHAETDGFKAIRQKLYKGISLPTVMLFHETRLPFELSEVEVDALLRFLGRPWFTRLWVVQEVALAPSSRFHVGPYEGPMLEIMLAVAWLFHVSYSLQPRLGYSSELDMVRQIVKYACTQCSVYGSATGRNPDLLNTMRNLRKFRTHDPRDHVFACIGLLLLVDPNVETPALLKPDYNKSLPSVLRDAARAAIMERHDLAALKDVNHREGYSTDMPSWVPRWHQPHDHDLDAVHLPAFFNACGTYKRVQFERNVGEAAIEPDVLAVLGVRTDIVQEVMYTFRPASDQHGAKRSSEQFSLNISPAKCVDLLSAARRMLGDVSIESDPHGITRMLASTLTCERDYTFARLPPDDASAGFQAWENYVQRTGLFPPQVHVTNDMSDQSLFCDKPTIEYHLAFINACNHRSLFITAGGRLGLGPQSLRAGDAVAVLYGSGVPLLVWPLADNNEYQLVGHAYVNGIMWAESVWQHQQDGVQANVFRLR